MIHRHIDIISLQVKGIVTDFYREELERTGRWFVVFLAGGKRDNQHGNYNGCEQEVLFHEVWV